MGKLIVIQGGREIAYELLDDVVFVGSGEQATVKIKGEGVAPQHCQILKVEKAYRLVDLSGHGVMVSGQRVSQHALKNGDIITVGGAQIHYRGADAPAPTSRATTSSRQSSNIKRPNKVELKIDPNVTAAAKQREVHIRKGARAKGLPLPALIAIIAAGLGLVLWALSGVFGGMTNHPELIAKIDEADRAIQERRFDDARAILNSIPEDAPNYRFAQMKLRELDTGVAKQAELETLSAGNTLYENNIQGFIRSYVETNDPRYKGQTGYVRYLVKRLEKWLKDYPGHPREPDVKALYAKFKPLVPAGGPTLDDVIIESECEANIRHYGYSYKLLQDWLDKNATLDAANAKVVTRKQTAIKDRATTYWKNIEGAALKQVESGKFAAAYDDYHDAMEFFDGIPDLHAAAKGRCDELQSKLNAVQQR